MIEQKGMLYAVLSMMYYNNEDTLTPELISIMGVDNYFKLVACYGGTKVKIPQPSEVSTTVQSAIALYEMNVNNKSPEWVQANYKISKKKMAAVRKNIDKWKDNAPQKEQSYVIDGLKQYK